MKSVSPQGCARGFAVGALLAACVANAVFAGASGANVWPTLASLLVGLAAVLWPAGRRPDWLTPQVRTTVPHSFRVPGQRSRRCPARRCCSARAR
ncbi:hypothetical protein [Streptomyces sp. NBC_01235]|uniref:hypothetical protein n=1 Tax=Streptomyces sp. NBC_01235 TaxID=2903788 RepID=UPI002E15056E